MEFFGWDSRFATGIASVDDQHHWLVDQMNAFTEMISRSDEIPRAELERVFSLLMDYAIRHFSDEESLMEEAGIDPRHLEKHKHEHQAYIQALAQDQKAILDTPTTAHHLLTFLGNWLVYHITGRDQGMAKQIAAIHAGTPPSEAYALEVHSREGAADPLLKALNAMVDQIMDRNSELMQWNRTLEARVDERTQALQEAMGKLAAEMAESRRLTTELADANEQLRQAALTDVLTGLPNRRHARERLRQFWSESLRHGTPFSCIMIDADGFKQVNDTYGHEAGDAVLRELARTLSSNTRSEDVVCRLGGVTNSWSSAPRPTWRAPRHWPRTCGPRSAPRVCQRATANGGGKPQSGSGRTPGGIQETRRIGRLRRQGPLCRQARRAQPSGGS